MFRRWHHGHSLGAGGFAGALLALRYPLLLLAGVFAAGVAATLFVVYGRRMYLTLLGAFEAWRSDRSQRAKVGPVETGLVPVYPTTRKGQTEEVPF